MSEDYPRWPVRVCVMTSDTADDQNARRCHRFPVKPVTISGGYDERRALS